MNHNSHTPKTFAGQYSGERVLFYAHEHTAYFIWDNITNTLIAIAAAALGIWFAASLLEMLWLGIGIAAGILIGFWWYLRSLHHGTSIIVTSRRIIKTVKHGLFPSHRREVVLGQIAQVRSDKHSFMDIFFSTGTVHFTTTDLEGSVYFRGTPHAAEVALYVSRILDYLRANGPTDNLSSFKRRKDRQQNKNTPQESQAIEPAEENI